MPNNTSPSRYRQILVLSIKDGYGDKKKIGLNINENRRLVALFPK